MQLTFTEITDHGITLSFHSPYSITAKKDKSDSLWIASDPSIDLYVFADDIDQLRQEIAEWFVLSYQCYVVGRVGYQLNDRAKEVGLRLDTLIKKEPG